MGKPKEAVRAMGKLYLHEDNVGVSFFTEFAFVLCDFELVKCS